MKAADQASANLKGTPDYGLQFDLSKLTGNTLTFYSDADFAGEKKSRR